MVRPRVGRIGRCLFAACAMLIGPAGAGAQRCETAGCAEATGACCLRDNRCVVVTARACALLMGSFRGNNVPCSNAACELDGFARGDGTGPVDFNRDGRVDVADAVLFMNAYAAGAADVNGDGATDARDAMLFRSLFVDGSRD